MLLLGAAGSLSAHVILKSVPYVRELISKGTNSWNKRESRRNHEIGFTSAILISNENIFETTLYIAYRIARLLVFLSITLLFSIVFVAMLPSAGTPALTTHLY